MRSAVLPRRPGAPGWIRTNVQDFKRIPLWPLSYESIDRAAGFEPARDYSIAVNLGVEPSSHRPERCVLPIDQSTIAICTGTDPVLSALTGRRVSVTPTDHGWRSRIRTYPQGVNSARHYHYATRQRWTQQDSNPPPRPCKSRALPDELLPHVDVAVATLSVQQDSNLRLLPCRGSTLPLSYGPGAVVGVEPTVSRV